MLLIILMWKGFACSSTVCRLLSTQIRRNMKASICYHETCLSVYGPVSRQCQYVFVVPIACLASNHHRLLHGVLWVGYYTNILLLILSFYLNIVGGHPLSSYYYATEMLALTLICQPTWNSYCAHTVDGTYVPPTYTTTCGRHCFLGLYTHMAYIYMPCMDMYMAGGYDVIMHHVTHLIL